MKKKLSKKKTIWLIVTITCVLYIISPFDLIPDYITVFGKMDDLLTLVPVIFGIINLIRKEQEKIENEDKETDEEVIDMEEFCK